MPTLPETLPLRHYSPEAVNLDRTRLYEQFADMKPRGFWVSVSGEHDWSSWCRSEDFDVESLQVEHDVRLSGAANILLLEGAVALDEFTAEYRTQLYPGYDKGLSIDWPAVASRYDGIVITPYVWARRLDLIWYYGWDCASGCIWNLDAIEHVSATE